MIALVMIAGLVIALARSRDRRRALVVLVLPVVLVGGWYVKNWALFGEPTATTWFGMNLAKVAL